MFERITINRQSLSGEPIDLGFLAECLLFYAKVRVIADVETFRYLVRCCGPDELLELLTMEALEIEFFDNITGIGTIDTSIGPLHEFSVSDSSVLRYPQVSRKLFDELAGPSGKNANRMFRRFDRFIERSRYTPEMLKDVQADILDNFYVGPAIHSLLSLLAPEYAPPQPFVFSVQPVLKGGTYKVNNQHRFQRRQRIVQPARPSESLDPDRCLFTRTYRRYTAGPDRWLSLQFRVCHRSCACRYWSSQIC